MYSQQFPFTINTILNNQTPPNLAKSFDQLLSSPTNGGPPSSKDLLTVFYSPNNMLNLQQQLINERHNQFLAATTYNQNFQNLAQKEKRAGHPYQSRAPPRHKKPRTSFTKNQVAYLENRFLEQKYLASAERAKLAHQLNMSDAQVKTWFQNRRTKWR